MDWSPLVGIPYQDHGRTRDGCDCWGLVRLGLRALGTPVPDYLDLAYTAHNPVLAAKTINEHREPAGWTEVEKGAEQVGDVVLISFGGFACHCGLVIQPGTMLHCLAGAASCIERYTGVRYERRLAGIYRLD